jgi:hypothetical protein
MLKKSNFKLGQRVYVKWSNRPRVEKATFVCVDSQYDVYVNLNIKGRRVTVPRSIVYLKDPTDDIAKANHDELCKLWGELEQLVNGMEPTSSQWFNLPSGKLMTARDVSSRIAKLTRVAARASSIAQKSANH